MSAANVKIVKVRTLWIGAVSLCLFGFGCGSALFYYGERSTGDTIAATVIFAGLAYVMFRLSVNESH